MQITVKGTAKLLEALRDDLKLAQIKHIVKLNGSQLQQKAMQRVPVKTGTLKRSIVLSIEDDGLTAHVDAYEHYAGYVNYGTRLMESRPFMTTSFHEQSAQFLRDLRSVVR